eukprot:4678749-Pyramimonas_sp.AAC.1
MSVPGRTRNVNHATLSITGEKLYIEDAERVSMRQDTSDELHKQIVEAHRAGPAPPRVATIRRRTYNTSGEMLTWCKILRLHCLETSQAKSSIKLFCS